MNWTIVAPRVTRKTHDVSKIAPASTASCATAVLVDPGSGNRIAGSDPRRDCYAMAY